MLLTAASRIAVHPSLQLCSSATSTWTDPVWKQPTHPFPWLILYMVFGLGCPGCVWKPPGDDCHPSFQAAALSSQLLDCLSGLRGLSGGSDRDALQHGQICGELLVLWSQILCPSQFLWCGILLLFSLPLVLHLHRQVHCCYWPPGLSHQVHGVCVRGMHQHLLDSAHCVQRSCVLHRCQWWWDGGISKCSQLYMGFGKCFVIFYIPYFLYTIVMIILYGKIF